MPVQVKSKKKTILFLVKVAFSGLMLWYVFREVASRDGAGELWARLGDVQWGWWALAAAMQLVAIGFAITRWRLLLGGQGIHAPWRFLVGSFFIGRFWGAFTLGGLGLDGWRLYDVAERTGKVARATAVAGVEKVLGQVAFGLVVLGGSLWGVKYLGIEGVLLVNGFFAVLVAAGLTLLARPQLFRVLASWLPTGVRVRVQTLIDAVCEYHGKARMLATAVLLGIGVHAFNNLIYVCAARAVGVELSLGVVFFYSSLQIMATLVPASINGIGLRETTAVALYTSAAVGLSATDAVLIPIVGFAAEMFVSAWGGLVFVARRGGRRVDIRVDDADREKAAHAVIEEVPAAEWPKRARGLTIGLGAGLLAGVIVGLAEGAVVVSSAHGGVGLGVITYGAVAYGLFSALVGGGLGFALADTGRLMKRRAMPEPQAYARITAFLVASMALGLGAFRIRRDLFAEQLKWKSVEGIGVLLGCLVASVVLYLVLSALLRFLVNRKPGSVMLRAWGSPAVLAVVVAATAGVTLLVGQPAVAAPGNGRPAAPDGAGNVLVIVVDTLRADHLPAWGYERGSTPNLDAFAADAVRFDQAFTNSSWTRPSFASFLTGRSPRSHGVMLKPDALPDAVVTLPEALKDAGWYTTGFVTNYNVAPYFNFQQGFDEYRYLEPEFVLGADDAAAKLLLVQTLRQGIEKLRAWRGGVQPGTAYQDAETVNRAITSWLDRGPQGPWFLFVGYMDPHDPYFVHPYDGSGYSRAAHQHPDLEEAPELRRLYDGEITYWDAQLGRLVEDLRRRGVYDDMTIVVTSDHGEEFGEHGGFWHGTTLYDEQVLVPLYVKLPGNRRGGTTVRHWVQSIDLMPTLLREQGVAVPDGVQGGDIFQGTDRVYAWESHEGNDLESVRERRGTDELKLITANPQNPRGLEILEMYRVDHDPAEQQNLAGTRRADVESLVETLVGAAREAREGAVQQQTVGIDREACLRLLELGYVESCD
jgi:arylsulfatase A-like enzyme/uncharacterized membrane protein YbhN (UPF0104 family)